MTNPNITIGEQDDGRWFAEFKPEGHVWPIRLTAPSQGEAQEVALAWLDMYAVPLSDDVRRNLDEDPCSPVADWERELMERLEPKARGDILEDALRLTGRDRNKVYGDPQINHQRIAAIMTVLLDRKLAPGVVVTASDAALLMVAVKLARLVESPAHLDSFVDGAAYMAIAGEIALRGDDNE
jgi:hypothetical protein